MIRRILNHFHVYQFTIRRCDGGCGRILVGYGLCENCEFAMRLASYMAMIDKPVCLDPEMHPDRPCPFTKESPVYNPLHCTNPSWNAEDGYQPCDFCLDGQDCRFIGPNPDDTTDPPPWLTEAVPVPASVAAIEAEARAAERERIRAAVERLGLPRDAADPTYIRGWDEALAAVLRIIDAQYAQPRGSQYEGPRR